MVYTLEVKLIIVEGCDRCMDVRGDRVPIGLHELDWVAIRPRGFIFWEGKDCLLGFLDLDWVYKLP
jgi:hypothetical protein